MVCPPPRSHKTGIPAKYSRINTYDLPWRKPFVPHYLRKNTRTGVSIRPIFATSQLTKTGHASFRRSVRTNPSRPLHSSHLGCKIPSGPSKALETSPLFVVSNQMSGLTLPVVLTDLGFQGLYLQ